MDRFPDSPMSHRSGYGNRLVTLPGCKAVRSYYPRNARRRPSVPLIRLMAINRTENKPAACTRRLWGD